MAWSIREVAATAGVSPRAVRHYNAIGLLDPPTRLPNGHKRYDVAHLNRLLQIRRLVGLGFSLARIADLGGSGDGSVAAVRALDAELADTVVRLRRARRDLGAMVREGTPTELTPEFAVPPVVRGMNGADRSFVVVMSRVLGPGPRRAYAELVRDPSPDPVTRAFEGLPADADERTRREVTGAMVPYVRGLHAARPELAAMHIGSPYGSAFARRAIEAAKAELYNPAQIDVMRRIRRMTAEGG
ncbi:MerR family transcriptional regulator [Pseudonocardia sp. HH130630-07]|uniref:MerR family transcriptional regulator n=1 Tax=Pseudonocardia sp. HH130630-07 TaxID=1690815 RepID=UPI000814CDBE|nr:MerR family transcriptional regulator [Pseudonocardia sp. HH130630-07]ANY05326.1 hypothetical protein AFB00_02245 [Pseudonocardia sp. HH130630-07]